MTLAKNTLLELSADEKTRQLALERDLQAIAYGVTMSAALEEGRQEGRQEGRLEMLLAGLGARGDVLTDEQRARLVHASAEELQRWLGRAVRGVPLADLFDEG